MRVWSPDARALHVNEMFFFFALTMFVVFFFFFEPYADFDLLLVSVLRAARRNCIKFSSEICLYKALRLRPTSVRIYIYTYHSLRYRASRFISQFNSVW